MVCDSVPSLYNYNNEPTFGGNLSKPNTPLRFNYNNNCSLDK